MVARLNERDLDGIIDALVEGQITETQARRWGLTEDDIEEANRQIVTELKVVRE